MIETCFVIMPIGNQKINEVEYSEIDLKNKYDNCIKKALSDARPGMEIIRSDEVSMPGSISDDILTKLMFSKFVVADVSLPNPNVYYELGIRHAIRLGTILLKDKNINNAVFDISHLRYIEYENTTTGLKELTNKLKKYFSLFDNNPQNIDNQFIKLAAFLKFKYPTFVDVDDENKRKETAMINVLTPILKSPDMFKVLIDSNLTQEEKNNKMMEYMQNDPEFIVEMIKNMISGGILKP
jgi:hypothetical protein